MEISYGKILPLGDPELATRYIWSRRLRYRWPSPKFYEMLCSGLGFCPTFGLRT
jgi:hypothetical protein